MQRRDFLKNSLFATGIIASTPSLLASSKKDEKHFVLSYEAKMPFQSAQELKLYIPLPMPTYNQKISNLTINGDFQNYQIEKIQGAPFIFTQLDSQKNTKHFSMQLNLSLSPYKPIKSNKAPQNHSPENRYIRTDGAIGEIANKVKYLDDQSKVAYFSNFIKKEVQPEALELRSEIRRLSDSKQTLLIGENLNANSILVALCHASNIPAKEVFGLDSKSNPHNQAEVFINNSWHRIDLADKNDFIAFNHLRDIRIDGILQSGAHTILGSIDGNNLQYYKSFKTKLKITEV